MTSGVLASAPDRPRLSTFAQAALSLFWFGTSVHWTVILITTLPHQAQTMGGDAAKGQTLGVILLIGAFVSMVVAPVAGAISDRVVTRLGRRRPWIVLGVLMNLIGLGGLAAFARPNDPLSLPLYILAFMWVEFWNNVATAPYAALIPDTVPAAQRGSASGWYGLMNILGLFVGALAPFLFTAKGETDITALYWFVGVALFLSMLGTVVFVKEPRVTRAPPPFHWGEFARGLVEPLRDHDFRWVFWTRFLMVMGVYTVQEFLQYYMGDAVKDFSLFGTQVATNAATAASVFLLMLLLGALPSSLVAGYLSDRLGRKIAVYFSSASSGDSTARVRRPGSFLWSLDGDGACLWPRLWRIPIGGLGACRGRSPLRRRLCKGHGCLARGPDLSSSHRHAHCGCSPGPLPDRWSPAGVSQPRLSSHLFARNRLLCPRHGPRPSDSQDPVTH